METVFYYPEVRQVAVGLPEGDAVRYVLSGRRENRPLPTAGDNVLDFDACRRALAEAEELPLRSELPRSEPPRERPARRRDDREEALLLRLGLVLDLCATAAVVVFTVVMTAHMLGAF